MQLPLRYLEFTHETFSYHGSSPTALRLPCLEKAQTSPHRDHTEGTWYPWREKEMPRQPQVTLAPHWFKLHERPTTEPLSLAFPKSWENNEKKKHNGCCFKPLSFGVNCYVAIANQNSEKQRNVRKVSETVCLGRTLSPTWFPPPPQDFMLLSSWFYKDTWEND